MVAIDDRITLGEGSPDMGFLQVPGDVQVLVVPEEFCARLPRGCRMGLIAYIHERFGPRSGFPRVFVEPAIDGHAGPGAIRGIGANVVRD